jgi:hypothetical protein
MIVNEPFIKCEHCGKIHDPKNFSFYTVQGNIYLGLAGGLIGNNIRNGEVKINHYCCDCLFEILKA